MSTTQPQLIVFAGLPGVGKTTLAKKVTQELRAVYLRVDSIETPFRKLGMIGAEGYVAIAAVARENIQLGNSVVLDLVNAVHQSREMFVALAVQTGADLRQFECSLDDPAEHRRRIENRVGTEQHNPSWEEVLERGYDAWDESADGERTAVEMSDLETAYKAVVQKLRSNT